MESNRSPRTPTNAGRVEGTHRGGNKGTTPPSGRRTDYSDPNSQQQISESDRPFYRPLPGSNTVPMDVVKYTIDAVGVSEFKKKVDQKAISLDNRKREDGPAKKTKAGKLDPRRARKHKALTAMERKHLGVFKVPEGSVKYEDLATLQSMWRSYFAELLGPAKTFAGSEARLVKADFQGAEFVVIRSKNPTFVGLRGVVIQETERIFRIVTPLSEMKVVPKAGNVFSVLFEAEAEGAAPAQRIVIHGNHFIFKPADRSSRKFKVKSTVEL